LKNSVAVDVGVDVGAERMASDDTEPVAKGVAVVGCWLTMLPLLHYL
jgi:hypothetical protein